MASATDILSLTHIAITSTVQLISAIRRQFLAYHSLPALLDSAAEKSKRIESSIQVLLDLTQVTDLKSDFFERVCERVRNVEQELNVIHREISTSSSRAAFLASSDLVQRLSSVNEKLEKLDLLLNTVGLTGDIVIRNVHKECAGLSGKLDELCALLNNLLSQQDSSRGVNYVFNAIQSDESLVFKGLSNQRLNNPDLLATEHYAQVYYSLGLSYYKGEHENGKDFDSAARFLFAAFEGGSKNASYYLGKLHYNGQGVCRNFEVAYRYFKIGAENGHPESFSEMGWCNEFGHGTQRDPEAAVKFYEKGAQGGSAMGMRNLGYHCLHGNACRQNWPRAVKLFEKARVLGEIRANFDLAHCHEHGIGVEWNPKRAAELLKVAVHAGEEMATSYLARYYLQGIGVGIDYHRAAELYYKLKDNGWLGRLHQGYYGLMLIRGLGVEKNVESGLRMVRAGLKKGFGVGYAVYGDCWRHGYGVKRNSERALKYYSLAASCSSGSCGVRDAHSALAEMYDTGEGVTRSVRRAVYHYIEAASRMNRTAQWKAASYLETGNGVDEHKYQAFYFFDLAARGGHEKAQRKAAQMYMKGFGVQRDRSRAVQMLEEAVQRGDNQAKGLLRRALLLRLLEFGRRKTI